MIATRGWGFRVLASSVRDLRVACVGGSGILRYVVDAWMML